MYHAKTIDDMKSKLSKSTLEPDRDGTNQIRI